MRRKTRELLDFCFFFLVAGVVLFSSVAVSDSRDAPPCSRIISLAPSITEIAIALGLREHLVGVSSFDAQVADSLQIPKVGNLFQFNQEAVLSLHPSVVMYLREQGSAKRSVRDLKLPSLEEDHRALASIRSSITHIATFCQEAEKGEALLRKLTSQAQSIVEDSRTLNESSLGKDEPRVLIVIGGRSSEMSAKRLFVSGKDGFFYDLLMMLGIEPAFHENTQGIAGLSLEALVTLRPTHILHILPPGTPELSKEELKQLWREFEMLPAVRQGQVFSRSDRFFSIPGIEYPQVLKAFKELFLERENPRA